MNKKVMHLEKYKGCKIIYLKLLCPNSGFQKHTFTSTFLNNEDIVAWTSNPFLAFDTEAGSLFSMGSWSFGASSSSSMSITAVSFCTHKLRKIKYKFPDNIEYKINEVLNFRLTVCNKKKGSKQK